MPSTLRSIGRVAQLLPLLGLISCRTSSAPAFARPFDALLRNLKHGTLRAGTPVERVLALGKARLNVRIGPYQDLEYGYESDWHESGVRHRIKLHAYRGRLVAAYHLVKTWWPCGKKTNKKRIFDVMTRAQRERRRFLWARHGCRPAKALESSCDELADLYREGKGVRRDLRRARAIHDRRCQRGDPRYGDYWRCLILANWLLDGKLGPPNLSAAKRYAARSCRLGYGRGCKLYLTRFVSARTPPTERLRWETQACACRNAVPQSCEHATARALAGIGSAALRLRLERAAHSQCKNSSSSLCIYVSQLVAQRRAAEIRRLPAALQRRFRGYLMACRAGWRCRYVQQLGKPGAERLPDLATLRESVTRRCRSSGTDGCAAAGLMLLHGVGGSVDRKTAKGFLVSACDNASSVACHALGTGWRVGWWGRADWKLATQRLTRACSDINNACLEAARVLLTRPRQKVPSTNDVRKVLANACVRAGHAAACLERVVRWPQHDLTFYRPTQNSATLLERVCFPGRKPACRSGRTSVMWHQGKWRPLSQARALALLSRACRAAVKPACALRDRSKRAEK